MEGKHENLQRFAILKTAFRVPQMLTGDSPSSAPGTPLFHSTRWEGENRTPPCLSESEPSRRGLSLTPQTAKLITIDFRWERLDFAATAHR